jgi:type I site-specific restriction endonuclease
MSLAVIKAKANKHEMAKGMQQGLEYARLLDVPFILPATAIVLFFTIRPLQQHN